MARTHPAQEHLAPNLNHFVELDAAELERRAATLEAASVTHKPRGITDWQRDCIRRFYKRVPTRLLAEQTGLRIKQIYNHATDMGLQGTPDKREITAEI